MTYPLDFRTLLVISVWFLGGFLMGIIDLKGAHPILIIGLLLGFWFVMFNTPKLLPEIFKDESLKFPDQPKE